MLIAKYFALIYFTYGLGLLLNKKFYQKMIIEYLKSGAGLILGGLLALIIGLSLVIYHNIWETSWVLIITLFGWAALIKGVIILLFPEEVSKLALKWYKNQKLINLVAVLSILLGLMFGYLGALGTVITDTFKII